jgi:phosphohistidine phosphatase
MKIYLMQHGKPVPKEEDPDRPLSARGREDVARMANFLKGAGVEVGSVFHSGKTRARQTAEIVTASLKPGSEPIEKKGLSPLDDVGAVAEEIKRNAQDPMLVGHLPHLGKLASFLTTGSESRSVVSFQQGGVVCLRSDEGVSDWTVAWMLIPEIISH